jgi:hypothetical protein
MMKARLFASAMLLAAAPIPSVGASPPPPPPAYVAAVARLLTQSGNSATPGELGDFIAEDVQSYVNGKLVAKGKAQWEQGAAKAPPSSGLLGYSEGWKDGGTLMIVDQFDSVGRSSLPAGFVADPRYATRSTLYQFGSDGKIHAIRTELTDGFWIKP